MNLREIRNHLTEVTLEDKAFLFSYSTLVAYIDLTTHRLCVTEKFHSNTTSKHINEWTEMLNDSLEDIETIVISQQELNQEVA